jgi:tetratricopeptide (TPR) repeat protein
MTKRSCGFVALLVCVASSRATAWAQTPGPGDVPAAGKDVSRPVIEQITTAYRFEGDGSGERRQSVTALVATQAAVSEWGTLSFSYMAATEELSLRELVVEKPDGRRVETKDARLEDVTATGQVDEPIVTDWRAKRITVPALQPGDRLHYEVVIRRSASLVPGQFWVDHSFIRRAAVMNEVFEVDVPASRPIAVHARRGVEVAVPSPPAGRRILRWSHSQAVAIAPPADARAQLEAMEEEKQGPDVRVSSFTSWPQVSHWFADLVATRVAPDETVRAKALELTRGIDSSDGKLRALFAFVSSRVRYVSLAFGMGRFEPRSPAQVLATEYGDCKDKHVLLASLARAIGQELSPVLLSSGALLEERVPSPSQFDHVVSVRIGPGEPATWLWMDTTTGLLPPGALLVGFRDRKVLLVGGAAGTARADAAAIIKSPASAPVATVANIEVRGSVDSRGGAKLAVVRRMSGDFEYLMRYSLRDADQQALNRVAQGLSREDGLGKGERTIGSVDFHDEGPGKGVVLGYEVTHKYTLPSTAPWPLWVPVPDVGSPPPPEEGDMELGEPATFAVTARYEIPPGTAARPPVDVTLNRPFARYTSQYRVESNVLVLERRIETLVRTIKSQDFDDYRAFRTAVDADYRQTFAVEGLTAAASLSSADELNSAGNRAIGDRDYTRAADLLKRAVAMDPKHRAAWNNLGRAYIGLRDLDAALDALEKQIAVNPYDEYAYANIGRVRYLQGRLDQALAQFRKQIEVAPLRPYAYSEIGRIQAERKQWAEAEASFDKAVALSPKDAELWMDLGEARLARENADAAVAAFDRSLELAPGPTTRNSVAWALVEKGVRLDVAETHVRAAIDGATAALSTATLDALTSAQLRGADSLAAYWDTLGWLYFQRGDLDQADAWLEAAWALSADGAIAEHLGQLYERRGTRDRAIRFYAQGVAATNDDASRTALERLVPAAGREAVLDEARRQLAAAKITALPARLGDAGVADFYFVVDSGRITGTRAISGDDRLQKSASQLVGLTVPPGAPDGKPLRLIRQGVVDCSAAAGCALSLVPSNLVPTDALPSK